MSDPSLPVAGWYADPTGADQLRWWGGLAWTEHVQPRPAPVVEPVEAAPYAPATPYVPFAQSLAPLQARPTITYVASSNTVAIWSIVVLPLAWAFVVLLMWSDLSTTTATWALASLALLVVEVGLVLWDNYVLSQRGLPAPSVLWVLLSVIAYVIARRVKLKRAGIASLAPGNVMGVTVAVAIGLTIILSASQTQATVNTRVVQAMEALMEQRLVERNLVGWTVACDESVYFKVGTDLPCSASNPTAPSQQFTLKLNPDGTVDVVLDEPGVGVLSS